MRSCRTGSRKYSCRSCLSASPTIADREAYGSFHLKTVCGSVLPVPPADDRIRRNIPGHNCTRADYGTVAYGHACHDQCLVADPYIVSDCDISFIVPGIRHVFFLQPPLFRKERKGIGGQRRKLMICTVEKKLRAAGNGAEFSDDQPFVIDRIVVQHIVLLKIRRIFFKVIVDRIVADRNIRVGDYILQINCISVFLPRIDKSHRHSVPPSCVQSTAL